MYPSSKIIGFEPDPETMKILNENIELNSLKNVTLVNKAVDNKKGKLAFYTDADNISSPGMSLYNRIKKQTNKTGKINVEVTKLSEYISSEVDILKIDVEGSELGVLTDLEESKKLNFIKELVIEYHYNTHPKNKLSKILQILENNNYEYEISSTIEPPFKRTDELFFNILVHAYRK